MATKPPTAPELKQYVTPRSRFRSLRFWLTFIIETLTYRRLSRLVIARLGHRPSVKVEGIEFLPKQGTFIFAANHYKGSATLDVAAAIFFAAGQMRPEFAEQFLMIAGQRQRKRTRPRPLPAKVIKRLIDFAFHRWQKNILRIALGNERASVKSLREWRQRINQQPALVFPEGKAMLQFNVVRRGAGRWLQAQNIPIFPVGVWWVDGIWHVSFGAAIQWSHRPELYDLQLGLNIAALLPDELAPRWQKSIQEWKAAHAQEVAT